MSTMWHTTPLSAIMKATTTRVSIVNPSSNHNAFSTLSKSIPNKPGQQRLQLWGGLQGHHYQRFLSSSTRAHTGLVKSSSRLSPKTLITAGAVTTFIFGPLIWTRNIAYCASNTTEPDTTPKPVPEVTKSAAPNAAPQAPGGKDPFVSTRELSFGTTMGLCSGYLFKKLGKMFALVAGLGFVSLQLLANTGYIQVNWGLIESKFTEKFDLDKDGKVTVKDAKYGIKWVIGLLTRNFQFKSTFAGGFYIGFQYG
ncbi:hypothetical protein BGZ76_003770 [Entomortierella beljakovae]|nr:hypothetical protein BGZ76_003770 [Entomortierella beljakovae]